MIAGKPLKYNLSSGTSPVRMSQMPNNSIPRFFVNLYFAILPLPEKHSVRRGGFPLL
jgi:hypothetical protein